MKPIKTVFFGTHHFAKTILSGLYKSPLFDIQLVITQPDKPIGRKHILQSPPAKTFAVEYDIAVEQPKSLKDYHFHESFDLGITAQYGVLVPAHILSAPTYGVINIHTSLLPKYRGASPVQSAILHGEQQTGVTIMKMDEGLDTGPIIAQESLAIFPDEKTPELTQRLADLAVPLLEKYIPNYIDGSLKPQTQDHTKATLCTKISRADGRIDWSRSTQEIYNQFRAFTPWPGLWTTWEDNRIKLHNIIPATIDLPAGKVSITDDAIFIGTRDGAVQVTHLQLAGKKLMSAAQFIQGYRRIDGAHVA